MGFFEWYFAFVVFVLGACWGSFLNVCIYRIPAELSVVKPRSRCPSCLTNLAWKDNIPILGWLMLRGKCRYCQTSISPRYPIIELFMALLFMVLWLTFPIYVKDGGLDFRFIPYAVLFFGLVLGSMVDIDEMWIPDRCTIGGMIVGPLFSFIVPSMHGCELGVDALVQSLIGLAVGFGSLWSVGVVGKAILKKDAMGFGDVKLMGALGAFLGWQSIIFIVFVSALLGTIFGMTMIALGKNEWQNKIPFGPYIAFGAMAWVLGGSRLWAAYYNWISNAQF